MYQKLTADTVGAAHEIIRQAVSEIECALRERHLVNARADEVLGRPLRMMIYFAFNDLEGEGPVSVREATEGYTRFQANTVLEARDILTKARKKIEAEAVLRPVHRRHRKNEAGRPLRVTVFYNLPDLDRPGPLDVDECLWLPYDGIPPGLQLRNLHHEDRMGDWRPGPRPTAQPQRRTLLRLLRLR
ncbi:hypothetical protein [Streptomyces sp. NPDC102476]|uniref:hypothetical protein n=1 Tax=Streptomyces sp. NPDC102476 TaxID=3366181 RepID=UPI00380F3A26